MELVLLALIVLGVGAVVTWPLFVWRRIAPPSLSRIYTDPHSVRRSWWWHLPGPPVFLLLWIFCAPLIASMITVPLMFVAQGIDHVYIVVTRKSVEREQKKAAEKILADGAVTVKRGEEKIREAAEANKKRYAGWMSAASVDKERDGALNLLHQGSEAALKDSVEASNAAIERKNRESGPQAASKVANVLQLWSLMWGLTAIYLFRLWRRNRTPGGHHGFARWSKWREIITAADHRWVLPLWVAYYSTGRAWHLWERFIGWVGIVPFAPPEGDAVCSHYLVLGASGSGKGASVFGHVMATSKVPTIYQDEKAECPMSTHPSWAKAIQWGCAAEGGTPSQRWNPIEECRRDPDPQNAFLTLAAALIQDDAAGSENAWIAKLSRPVLAEILLAGEYDTLGELADGVRDKPLAQILDAVHVPAGLKAAMQGENVSEYVTTTLYSELSVFRAGWGREVTSDHDFSLDLLIDRGGYILGAETEASRRGPIRLMWTLLLRRLMRSGRPRPCNLIMDEAAKAGRIPHFSEALTTLRSRGVSIWSAWQSESLVLSVYGEREGTAILDGFGNRIALLHGIGTRDAEMLSRASGNWTKKRGGSMSFSLSQSPSAGYSTGGGEITAIPLITTTDILIRSRTPGDRWAIISARGASAKGNLIMARLVEAEWRNGEPVRRIEKNGESAREHHTDLEVEDLAEGR